MPIIKAEDNLAPQVPHVIITGNPIAGFRVTGPFKSEDAAVHFAEMREDALGPMGCDWWLMPMYSPTTEYL